MIASRLRVAAVQLSPSPDVRANVEGAERLIAEAADRGARLVVLPEVFTYMGPREGALASAEPIPGPTIDRLAGLARRLDIYLHCGSIRERVDGSERAYNTTVVLDPRGEMIARYRKIHLYDVAIGDQVDFQESATIAPGDEAVSVEIDGAPVGLSICYDLRFPELFRILALQGAKVIVLPAAFMLYTGKDHWEVLIRARAIENQVYMVAAAQFGKFEGGTCYGRSMVVDPWGLPIAVAQDRPGVVVSDLDLTLVDQVRRELPSLANRRPTAYRWPEPVRI